MTMEEAIKKAKKIKYQFRRDEAVQECETSLSKEEINRIARAIETNNEGLTADEMNEWDYQLECKLEDYD